MDRDCPVFQTHLLWICFLREARNSNTCLYVLKQHMRYLSAFLSLTARKCKVIRNLSSQFLEISLFFHRKHFQLKVTLKKALQNQSFQSWKLQTQYSTFIQDENETEKNTLQSNTQQNWPSSRVFLRNSKSGAPDNKVSVSPNWPYFRWLWFQRLARQLPPISTRISSANTTAWKDFCSKWDIFLNLFFERQPHYISLKQLFVEHFLPF